MKDRTILGLRKEEEPLRRKDPKHLDHLWLVKMADEVPYHKLKAVVEYCEKEGVGIKSAIAHLYETFDAEWVDLSVGKQQAEEEHALLEKCRTADSITDEPTPQPEEPTDEDYEEYNKGSQRDKNYTAFAGFDVIFEALGVNCDRAVKDKIIHFLMGDRLKLSSTQRSYREWTNKEKTTAAEKEEIKRAAEKRLKTLKNELVNRIIDK